MVVPCHCRLDPGTRVSHVVDTTSTTSTKFLAHEWKRRSPETDIRCPVAVSNEAVSLVRTLRINAARRFTVQGWGESGLSPTSRKLPPSVDILIVDFPGPRRCPCESRGSRKARSSRS